VKAAKHAHDWHEPWFVHHGVLLQSSVVEGGSCWQLANKGM